jgi:hypothetical protein
MREESEIQNGLKNIGRQPWRWISLQPKRLPRSLNEVARVHLDPNRGRRKFFQIDRILRRCRHQEGASKSARCDVIGRLVNARIEIGSDRNLSQRN